MIGRKYGVQGTPAWLVAPQQETYVKECYMQVLRNVLEQTQKNGVAIGHFNIADLVLLKAVFASARELEVPVLVGASEGEREFIGVR